MLWGLGALNPKPETRNPKPQTLNPPRGFGGSGPATTCLPACLSRAEWHPPCWEVPSGSPGQRCCCSRNEPSCSGSAPGPEVSGLSSRFRREKNGLLRCVYSLPQCQERDALTQSRREDVAMADPAEHRRAKGCAGKGHKERSQERSHPQRASAGYRLERSAARASWAPQDTRSASAVLQRNRA